MHKARLLLPLLICTLSVHAHAADLSVGDAYDTFNQFIVTVRVFDAFEKRDGTFQSSTNTAAGGFAALIMSEAWAIPGKDGTQCLLAGYYGMVKGGRCVPNSNTNVFDDKGNIICNPTTFGPGIVIPRPKDSRWTMACANEVIKQAGVANKTAEDKFSDDEIKKLGQFLRVKQGISFANNLYRSILHKCENVAPKSQDYADCARTGSVIADALNGYIASEPEGSSSTSSKSKTLAKSFEDCWKDWVAKGAKLKAKVEIPMKGKFDSFIDLKTLAGCRLTAIDESAWKSESIDPEQCHLPIGADTIVEGYTPADKNLHAFIVVNGTADCTKGGETIKKAGKFKMDCSTAGTKKTKVIYELLRVLERNFDLNPACAYVLQMDKNGKSIKTTSEESEKAQ